MLFRLSSTILLLSLNKKIVQFAWLNSRIMIMFVPSLFAPTFFISIALMFGFVHTLTVHSVAPLFVVISVVYLHRSTTTTTGLVLMNGWTFRSYPLIHLLLSKACRRREKSTTSLPPHPHLSFRDRTPVSWRRGVIEPADV